MRLTVVIDVDVDCMGDERELYLIIENGDHRSRACFRVDYVTHRRFSALYRRLSAHGKALAVLKAEGREIVH